MWPYDILARSHSENGVQKQNLHDFKFYTCRGLYYLFGGLFHECMVLMTALIVIYIILTNKHKMAMLANDGTFNTYFVHKRAQEYAIDCSDNHMINCLYTNTMPAQKHEQNIHCRSIKLCVGVTSLFLSPTRLKTSPIHEKLGGTRLHLLNWVYRPITVFIKNIVGSQIHPTSFI